MPNNILSIVVEYDRVLFNVLLPRFSFLGAVRASSGLSIFYSFSPLFLSLYLSSALLVLLSSSRYKSFAIRYMLPHPFALVSICFCRSLSKHFVLQVWTARSCKYFVLPTFRLLFFFYFFFLDTFWRNLGQYFPYWYNNNRWNKKHFHARSKIMCGHKEARIAILRL